MSTTPDMPPLPESAVKPTYVPAGAQFMPPSSGGPFVVTTPMMFYTAAQMQAYARTHADACIRALQIEAGKTQEALRSALGEVEELKKEVRKWQDNSIALGAENADLHVAALARAEKAEAEARAGGVPAGWKLVPLEPTFAMLKAGDAECDPPRTAQAHHIPLPDMWRAMLAAAPSAPSTPPDEATSRAQFEAYFLSSRHSKGIERRESLLDRRSEDDTYANEHTQRHWWTWQNAIDAAMKERA